MFEIGWTELMVIGVVALIVIGPKDLPDMFRQLGRFTAKMRSMARDFQRAMDQAANDSGISDVARDLKAAGSLKSTGLNAVKDAATKFEKWDPIKNAARPAPAAVTPANPVAATPASGADLTAEPKIHGPATQELIDAQARRAEIVRESTERLKAATAPRPPATPPAAAEAPPAKKPRRKPEVTAQITAQITAQTVAPSPVTPPDTILSAEPKARKPRKLKTGDA